jgi:O-antigen/teichoic acid export membrane protein
LITNLLIKHFVRKEYPYLNRKHVDLNPKIKADIFKNIKFLSISAIISVGVLGTDRILISSLIGITVLGVYSNYALIIQQVQLLFITLLNGAVASIGNLLAEGNKTKIQEIYKIYHFTYFLIASFTSIALYALLTPFITQIWLNQAFEMKTIIVMVIVFNSYLHFMRQPVWQIQTTSGIFKHYIPYSIIEFVVNLVVSIYGAIYWGIIGVFIGTSIAYIISWIGQAYILNKHVIHDSIMKFYLKQIEYLGLTLIELLLSIYLIQFIQTSYPVINFVLHGLLILTLTTFLNTVIYFKSNEFKYLKRQILDKLIKKLKRN